MVYGLQTIPCNEMPRSQMCLFGAVQHLGRTQPSQHTVQHLGRTQPSLHTINSVPVTQVSRLPSTAFGGHGRPRQCGLLKEDILSVPIV
jgi:hypothetical protein